MSDQSKENVIREEILKLLSNEELSKVTAQEEPPRLVEADEYIDLEHLERGVQQVHTNSKINTGNVIPRSAVKEETWSKIIKKLML